MAVCFDLYCTKCNHIKEDVMVDTNSELLPCKECGGEMKKMMGTTSFELKYDNRKDICDWDGNTSRYWDEVKRTGGDEPQNDRQNKWE